MCENIMCIRHCRYVLSGECGLPRGVSVGVVLPGVGRGPHPLPGQRAAVQPCVCKCCCVFSVWYASTRIRVSSVLIYNPSLVVSYVSYALNDRMVLWWVIALDIVSY
jgi:hypothetical protein